MTIQVRFSFSRSQIPSWSAFGPLPTSHQNLQNATHYVSWGRILGDSVTILGAGPCDDTGPSDGHCAARDCPYLCGRDDFIIPFKHFILRNFKFVCVYSWLNNFHSKENTSILACSYTRSWLAIGTTSRNLEPFWCEMQRSRKQWF